jgi:Na+/H+-dicarboxylate symporter
MTVIPLVASLLVVAVGQVSDVAATGRLAARALGWFAVLLVGAAVWGVVGTEALLALWPVDPASADALRAGVDPAAAPVAEAPSVARWLRSLVPSNPIAAAAEDQVLPVVVFALAFGLGAVRVPDREPLLRVLRAASEALIAIVRGVLWAAPVGVFALGVGVGARAGIGVAAVLLQYVVLVSAVTAGIVLASVALGALAVGPGRFLRAVGPVLVLAFSTQSSLACLPAMLERARDPLGVPDRVAGLVLPLAVAVFRWTSPVANLAVVAFVAEVYGVEPTLGQWAAGGIVALAVSVGSVGLPGQVSFFAAVAPIGLAVGVPLELLPVLLAVEVIPDLFRTMGNVAADLAVTATVGRTSP